MAWSQGTLSLSHSDFKLLSIWTLALPCDMLQHANKGRCSIPKKLPKSGKSFGYIVQMWGRGSLDDAVIGQGASRQLLSGQDLDESARGLPDLLDDASSPDETAHTDNQQLTLHGAATSRVILRNFLHKVCHLCRLADCTHPHNALITASKAVELLHLISFRHCCQTMLKQCAQAHSRVLQPSVPASHAHPGFWTLTCR